MMPFDFRHSVRLLLPVFTVSLLLWNTVPAMAQSGFVELVPSGPTMPPVAPGKSPWGGGVKLAAAFLGWVSEQGFKANVEAKLNELKPKIDSSMPKVGGVLVVIGVQQWAQADTNGNYNRSVLDGYVGGTGATPKSTMDAFLSQARLETGVPKGFVRRNIYFWKAASGK
jgi:hypothetical protein